MRPGRINYTNPVNRRHPLNMGLVGWWLPLANTKGGGTLRDIAGRNHGTLTNGPTWATGPNGFPALSFDGSDDHVLWNPEPVCAIHSTRAWAAEVVFRVVAASGKQTLLRSDASTGGVGNFWLLETSGGGWGWLPCGFSGVQDGVGSGVVAGVWTHVLATRTAAGFAGIYVNGVLNASTTGATAASGGSGNPMWMGAFNGLSKLLGDIASVRIYDGVDLGADHAPILYNQCLRGFPDLLNRVGRVVVSVPAGGGPAAYTLTADSGSVAISGTAATLKADRKLSAASGSFALTGTAASLEYGRVLPLASGSVALAGTAAGLKADRKLAADPGSVTLAGTAVTLKADRVLPAGVGAVVLTGQDATLIAGGDKVLAADPGAYALSGAAAGLQVARKLSAVSGSFALAGTDAALRAGRVLVCTSGAFVVTGQVATLTWSGEAGLRRQQTPAVAGQVSRAAIAGQVTRTGTWGY